MRNRSKPLVDAPEIPNALFGLAPSDSDPEAISKSWDLDGCRAQSHPMTRFNQKHDVKSVEPWTMAFLGYAWASTVIRLNTEAELVPALLGLLGKGSTMDHRIEDLHVQFSS